MGGTKNTFLGLSQTIEVARFDGKKEGIFRRLDKNRMAEKNFWKEGIFKELAQQQWQRKSLKEKI